VNIINRFKRLWGQKWCRRIIVGTAIIVTLSIPMRCHGPYKGRLIDGETSQPIVGAVAVASWTTVRINIAGGTTKCLDAQEAVTDQNGEFIIKGSRGPFFGMFTGTTYITVYKVGYRGVRCGWNYIENPGSCFQKPRAFDGDWAVFPLVRVEKDNLDWPPHVCGRKDGAPLTAWREEEERYHEAQRLNHRQRSKNNIDNK
jgi:hypothetical protein